MVFFIIFSVEIKKGLAEAKPQKEVTLNNKIIY